jgi:hypothetical protein
LEFSTTKQKRNEAQRRESAQRVTTDRGVTVDKPLRFLLFFPTNFLLHSYRVFVLYNSISGGETSIALPQGLKG